MFPRVSFFLKGLSVRKTIPTFVWLNKNNLLVMAIPCAIVGQSKKSHVDRVKIAVVRRMSHHAGIEVKEVLKRNVFSVRDFLKVRRETQRWEHEHERHYNARLLRALEAARTQGVIERV